MMDIDEQIRRAMEEGQFENLPGAGKPLHLDENPFEDPSWRLAHHLLRSSGFSLPWIERRREIEAELETTLSALRNAYAGWQEGMARGDSAVYVERVWQQAVALFRQRVADLNKQILNYNLEAPSTYFHLRLLDPDRELELTTSKASDTLTDVNPE